MESFATRDFKLKNISLNNLKKSFLLNPKGAFCERIGDSHDDNSHYNLNDDLNEDDNNKNSNNGLNL